MRPRKTSVPSQDTAHAPSKMDDDVRVAINAGGRFFEVPASRIKASGCKYLERRLSELGVAVPRRRQRRRRRSSMFVSSSSDDSSSTSSSLSIPQVLYVDCDANIFAVVLYFAKRNRLPSSLNVAKLADLQAEAKYLLEYPRLERACRDQIQSLQREQRPSHPEIRQENIGKYRKRLSSSPGDVSELSCDDGSDTEYVDGRCHIEDEVDEEGRDEGFQNDVRKESDDRDTASSPQPDYQWNSHETGDAVPGCRRFHRPKPPSVVKSKSKKRSSRKNSSNSNKKNQVDGKTANGHESGGQPIRQPTRSIARTFQERMRVHRFKKSSDAAAKIRASGEAAETKTSGDHSKEDSHYANIHIHSGEKHKPMGQTEIERYVAEDADARMNRLVEKCKEDSDDRALNASYSQRDDRFRSHSREPVLPPMEQISFQMHLSDSSYSSSEKRQESQHPSPRKEQQLSGWQTSPQKTSMGLPSIKGSKRIFGPPLSSAERQLQSSDWTSTSPSRNELLFGSIDASPPSKSQKKAKPTRSHWYSSLRNVQISASQPSSPEHQRSPSPRIQLESFPSPRHTVPDHERRTEEPAPDWVNSQASSSSLENSHFDEDSLRGSSESPIEIVPEFESAAAKVPSNPSPDIPSMPKSFQFHISPSSTPIWMHVPEGHVLYVASAIFVLGGAAATSQCILYVMVDGDRQPPVEGHHKTSHVRNTIMGSRSQRTTSAENDTHSFCVASYEPHKCRCSGRRQGQQQQQQQQQQQHLPLVLSSPEEERIGLRASTSGNETEDGGRWDVICWVGEAKSIPGLR